MNAGPPIYYTLPAGALVSTGGGFFPLGAPLRWRPSALGSAAGTSVLDDGTRLVVMLHPDTAAALYGRPPPG